MQTVELHYDFRSPYTYFASERLPILTSRGARIVWRPAFVDVLINLQQGRAPWDEVLDPLCPPKRQHFMADIFRLIEYWSIPFAMPSPAKPACNTAMSIAALLEEEGIGHDAYRAAVFRAVWQEQRDASDPEVLRYCLAASDLGPEWLDRADPEGKDLLTGQTCEAYERGVFGVPTFVFDGECYFGADRMELLAAKLSGQPAG